MMNLEKSRILWNKRECGSHYRIGLTCSAGYSAAQAGQFVMIRLDNQTTPLLRRPFSIHNLIIENGAVQGIEILYKVVGTFTQQMAQAKPGDIADVLGPLGKPFTIPKGVRRVFMVAGGVGAAPMPFLASSLHLQGIDLSNSEMFIGGRTRQDILCRKAIQKYKMSVHITTEDGSIGKKGIVTSLLESRIAQHHPDIIYACGPWGMLKAVAETARRYLLPCQVSIETLMACGMGACLGCAVETTSLEKYLHACIDGPVFDASILKFS